MTHHKRANLAHQGNQDYHQPHTVEELTETNIRTIADLEEAFKSGRSLADRVADLISAFCGSMLFVYVHLAWFGIWIVLNVGHLAPKPFRFDPYPFQFLTLIVSLEAIFLSTFILISQNRQGKIGERCNHLDLQINLLAEQENSKMLAMLEAIHKRLGIEESDPDVRVLEESTQPDKLVQQIEKIIEHGGQVNQPK